MTNRDHKLSLSRQADLLGISRGSLYYEPRPICEDDLRLMRRIDELHMEYPFAGRRLYRRAAACGDLHEADGHPGVVSQAEHVETGAGPQSLSLSAEKAGCDAPEPGLGHGHYLHSYGARFCLSGRRSGLVQPQGSGLAAIDDARDWPVHRSFEKTSA